MKKFLLSTLCTLPLLYLTAFASPVSLSLFQDGFSILDKLLLCGIGIVLLGAILLIIAFCKSPSRKEKPVDSPFDAYIEEDETQAETDFSEEESLEDEDTAEPEEDIDLPETIADIPAETDDIDPETEVDEPVSPDMEELIVEEPVVEEPVVEEPVVEEPKDEIIYPKLILTHTQTNDFVILPLYPETTVGRKTDNDLVLSDVTVSGLHCRILTENGAIYVLDEDSTNGTFINGERLTEKTQLHHGDKFTIGKQEFSVSVSE